MQPNDPDLPLVERIAAGDPAALDDLHARHAEPLRHYLRRLLGDPQLAEEVLQNLLLIVWRGAAAFRATGLVRAWLFGIARRQAFKTRRDAARRPTLADLNEEIDSADQPDQAAHADEIAALRTALRTLPPDERAALELVYYWGLSIPEAAGRLCLPIRSKAGCAAPACACANN